MMKTRSQTAAAAAAVTTAATEVTDMVSMFDRWKLPL